MSKKNNWKSREGVVYSTSEDFTYTHQQNETTETLAPGKQSLRVMLDNSGRAGKQVTLIAGFIGSTTDLEALTKLLKTKCGVGGSAKDGEILIQGDARDKIVAILTKEGFRARKI
jgi:translation initiation factor 1